MKSVYKEEAISEFDPEIFFGGIPDGPTLIRSFRTARASGQIKSMSDIYRWAMTEQGHCFLEGGFNCIQNMVKNRQESAPGTAQLAVFSATGTTEQNPDCESLCDKL